MFMSHYATEVCKCPQPHHASLPKCGNRNDAWNSGRQDGRNKLRQVSLTNDKCEPIECEPIQQRIDIRTTQTANSSPSAPTPGQRQASVSCSNRPRHSASSQSPCRKAQKCQSSEGRGATATRTIHCSGVLSIRRNFYAGLRYYRVCENFTVPDNHPRLWNVVSNAT